MFFFSLDRLFTAFVLFADFLYLSHYVQSSYNTVMTKTFLLTLSSGMLFPIRNFLFRVQ